MGGTSRAIQRRSYDSPVRRQRAAETRDRIVAAGVDIVKALAEWDWSGLTFRAVASAAGVSESTVYRHFGNERELHGAVMERLHRLAGVDYATVTLDTVGAVAAKVFESMSTFAAASPFVAVDDPTILGIDAVRRDGLSAAVRAEAGTLPASRRDAVAGVLDMLWSPATYERLAVQWGVAPYEATETIQWAIDLVVAGIRAGRAEHGGA